MRTLYSDGVRFEGGPSIFLAGPNPRNGIGQSWRPEALKLLEELAFDGAVLIPEPEGWKVRSEFIDHTEWEHAGLSEATVILFWIPRDMEKMPALTTNVEFGFWMASTPEKVVYGRPDSAAAIRYLDWMYTKVGGKKPFTTLEETVKAALELLRSRTSETTN